MTLRPLLTPICTKRFRQTLYSTMAPFSPRRLCDRQQPRQRRRPSFLRRSQAFRIPQAEMRNASRTIASRVSVIGLSAFLTFALTACGQQPEALVVGAPTECVDQPPVPPLTPEEELQLLAITESIEMIQTTIPVSWPHRNPSFRRTTLAVNRPRLIPRQSHPILRSLVGIDSTEA
jgi:hypothetical protein